MEEEATEVVVKKKGPRIEVWFLTVLIRRTKISPLLELEVGTHTEWWSNHRIKGEDLFDGGDVDVFKVNINKNKWKGK